MVSQRDKLVQVAAKYLGVRQGTPAWRNFTKGANEAWCADFVSYVAKEAGLGNVPQTNAVKTLYENAVKNNKFVKYPQPGDVVIYGQKGNGHTGIVESYNAKTGKITTIEGNTSMPGGGAYGVARKSWNYKQPKEGFNNSRGLYVKGFYSTSDMPAGNNPLWDNPVSQGLSNIFNQFAGAQQRQDTNQSTLQQIQNYNPTAGLNLSPIPDKVVLPEIKPSIIPKDSFNDFSPKSFEEFGKALPQSPAKSVFENLLAAQDKAMQGVAPLQLPQLESPVTATYQPDPVQPLQTGEAIGSYVENRAKQDLLTRLTPVNPVDAFGAGVANAATLYSNPELGMKAGMGGLPAMIGDLGVNIVYPLGGAALGGVAGAAVGLPEVGAPAGLALTSGALGVARDAQQQYLEDPTAGYDIGRGAIQGAAQGLTALPIPGLGRGLGYAARGLLQGAVDTGVGVSTDLLSQALEQKTLAPKVDLGRTAQAGLFSGLLGGAFGAAEGIGRVDAERAQINLDRATKGSLAENKSAALQYYAGDTIGKMNYVNQLPEVQKIKQENADYKQLQQTTQQGLEQNQKIQQALGDMTALTEQKKQLDIQVKNAELLAEAQTPSKGAGADVKSLPQEPEPMMAPKQTVEAPQLSKATQLESQVVEQRYAVKTQKQARLQRNALIERQGVNPDDIYITQRPDKTFSIEVKPPKLAPELQVEADRLAGQFNARREQLLADYARLTPEEYRSAFDTATKEYVDARRRLIQGEQLVPVEGGLNEAQLKQAKRLAETEQKLRNSMYKDKPVVVEGKMLGRVKENPKGKLVEVELTNGEVLKVNRDKIQPVKALERKEAGLNELTQQEIEALQRSTELPRTARLTNESAAPRGAENVQSFEEVYQRDPALGSVVDKEGIDVVSKAIQANQAGNPDTGVVVKIKYEGKKTSRIGESIVTPLKYVYFPQKKDANGMVISDSAIAFQGINEEGNIGTYFLHDVTRRSDGGYSRPTPSGEGKVQVEVVTGKKPQFEYNTRPTERTKPVETVEAVALRNEAKTLSAKAKEAGRPELAAKLDKVVAKLSNASKVKNFEAAKREIAALSKEDKKLLESFLADVGKCE